MTAEELKKITDALNADATKQVAARAAAAAAQKLKDVNELGQKMSADALEQIKRLNAARAEVAKRTNFAPLVLIGGAGLLLLMRRRR